MHASILLIWTSFTAAAVALSVPTRKRSEPAIIRRDEDLDDYDIFPFPANESSIDDGTQLDDPPGLNLTVNDVGTSSEVPKLFDNTCTEAQKLFLEDSWAEAALLAKSHTEHVDGYQYNIPYTQWLGKDWNSKGSWIPWKWKWNFRSYIGSNLRNLRRLFNNDVQGHHRILFLCKDVQNECDSLTAYSWDHTGARDLDGIDETDFYTVFCPTFFDLPSLTAVIGTYEDDRDGQEVMENFHRTRGGIMLHELFHYFGMVMNPETKDYAYRAQPAWDLAKKKGTNWAYANADSYHLSAVAIYVQLHYSSFMSPVPRGELAAFDPEAAAVLPPVPEDTVYPTPPYFGPEGPPGWTPPELIDGEPNPDDWEEWFPNGEPSLTAPGPTPTPEVPPLADENNCHGISGDYWVESRDVAAGNVEDFCAQSDTTMTYNADSANELELSVRRLNDDTPGADAAPYCVDRFMNAVIDGCDGGDPDSNPDNHKYGSTLTTSDGWEYKMTPLTEHVDEGEDDADGSDDEEGQEDSDEGDDEEEVDLPEDDPPSLPSCPGCSIN